MTWTITWLGPERCNYNRSWRYGAKVGIGKRFYHVGVRYDSMGKWSAADRKLLRRELISMIAKRFA